MRIFVIGGTGFIGSHVIRNLLRMGHSTAVLHRGSTDPEMPGVDHVLGDRGDLSSALELGGGSFDAVLDMIAMNERAAMDLMLAARRRTPRVIVVSSMDVYAAYGRLLRLEHGPPDPALLTEESPLRNKLYPYRDTTHGPDHPFHDYEKILVERAVMESPEIAGTVLRLPAVYGPGDRQHRVAAYLRDMDEGRMTIPMSSRKAQWKWTRGYVENVAAAVAQAVVDDRAKRRTYNVGELESLAEADWVRAIGRAAGWNGSIEITPEQDEEGDFSHHLAADTTRIRRELEFTDPITFDEALRRTISAEREESR